MVADSPPKNDMITVTKIAWDKLAQRGMCIISGKKHFHLSGCGVARDLQEGQVVVVVSPSDDQVEAQVMLRQFIGFDQQHFSYVLWRLV